MIFGPPRYLRLLEGSTVALHTKSGTSFVGVMFQYADCVVLKSASLILADGSREAVAGHEAVVRNEDVDWFQPRVDA